MLGRRLRHQAASLCERNFSWKIAAASATKGHRSMKTLVRLLGWIAPIGFAAPALAGSVQLLNAVGAGSVMSPISRSSN
jgi:hypothetical protein